MVKHLGEKLKSHRESQKGTRADAIIQIHPPTTTITFQTNCIVSMSQNSTTHQSVKTFQSVKILTIQSVNTLQSVKTLQSDKKLQTDKKL